MMPICIWGVSQHHPELSPPETLSLAGIFVILMALMEIVIAWAFRRWYALVQLGKTVIDGYGDQLLALATERGETVVHLPMQE